MSDLTRRANSAVSDLMEDLRTDWTPDPVGGLGLQLGRDAQTPIGGGGQLVVPTRTGPREVPLTSLEFRLWAHRATSKELEAFERRVRPEVFGYRDANTPYRVEWSRMQSELRKWAAKGQLVTRIDIVKFFGSVDPDQPGIKLPASVQSTMRAAQRHHGLALLPGHRWSRRVANMILEPLDTTMSVPFCRWQDDIWIATRSAEERSTAIDDVTTRLAKLGLAARVIEPAEPPGQFTASDGAASLREARRQGQVAAMKLTLRRLSESKDPSGLSELEALSKEFPVLLPRISMYLGAVIENENAQDILISMLADADLFGAVRLTAAACHRGSVARRVPGSVIGELEASPAWSIRGLAARVQREQGVAMTPAGPRIDEVLGRITVEHLRKFPPPLATTL